MRRNTPTSAATVTEPLMETQKSNGNSPGKGRSALSVEPALADLSVILANLQAVRDGDFSVRLPGSWTGLAGKIGDMFNAIVAANQ